MTFWLGLEGYPYQYLFHTSYLGQTLHDEFCIMYEPKSFPPIEQYPTTLSQGPEHVSYFLIGA